MFSKTTFNNTCAHHESSHSMRNAIHKWIIKPDSNLDGGVLKFRTSSERSKTNIAYEAEARSDPQQTLGASAVAVKTLNRFKTGEFVRRPAGPRWSHVDRSMQHAVACMRRKRGR